MKPWEAIKTLWKEKQTEVKTYQDLQPLCSISLRKYVLFRAEYKPRGYYLEHFGLADMGYMGQAKLGSKFQLVATWLVFSTEEYL